MHGGGHAATLAKCMLDIYYALIYYGKLHTVADSVFIDGGGGAQQWCVHHGKVDVEGALRGAGNAKGGDKGNNANAVRERFQREPTHNGRDRGGG
jgi:hypothetical protein